MYPNKYMHTDSPGIVINFLSASVADYETATPGLPKWPWIGTS